MFLTSSQGDHRTARTLGEESLAIWCELGDRWGTALALHNLGLAAYRHDDYESARRLYEESLTIWRERGDQHYIVMFLVNLGRVATRQGDYQLARVSFEEALTPLPALGDKQVIAYLLQGFAAFAAARGGAEQAARLFGAAEALRAAIGAPLPPADQAHYDRDVADTRSRLTDDAFTTSWVRGRALTLDEAIREATQT